MLFKSFDISGRIYLWSIFKVFYLLIRFLKHYQDWMINVTLFQVWETPRLNTQQFYLKARSFIHNPMKFSFLRFIQMDKENLQIQKLDDRVLCPWDQTVCPLPLENVEHTENVTDILYTLQKTNVFRFSSTLWLQNMNKSIIVKEIT